MADRVDKAWQTKGLKAYSNEAILGTLRHYGVQVDEAAFREQSRDAYPAHVASNWLSTWKGTGQFKAFPYAAALTLFERTWPERLLPTTFAEALAALMVALRQKLDGKADADTSAAFEGVSIHTDKLPPEDEAREKFMDEVVMHLGEQATRAFDETAEQLANAGHVDDARRFAELEELMLPSRRGIATAIVRAVAGDRQSALADIQAVLDDANSAEERRVMAVDAFIHLEELERAKAAAEPLLDKAEAAQDFHLGLAMCERLAHVYDKLSQWDALRALADRAQKLARAHDEAHPHHHGH